MRLFERFKNYVLNEINLGRLWQHTENKTIGIISAERDRSKNVGSPLYLEPKANKANNKANTAKLERAIRAAGFGYVRLKGHYIEDYGTEKAKKVTENSFLVISDKDDNGKLKGFLKKMGRTISAPSPQDSVLYKEAGKKAILIGTSRDAFPGLNREYVLGDWRPNRIGEFYTQMRNRKSFTFENLHYPKNDPNVYTRSYGPKDNLFTIDDDEC